MKPYVGLIIQSRLGSSRLPRKTLLEMDGIKMLEHVVRRCHLATLVDRIVIACPENPEACLNEYIFIGSEEDVLDRYYKCAKNFGFDVIVRITSDCILIPPYEIDRCIKMFINNKTDYVRNAPPMLDGYDVEVFSLNALKKAWTEATLKSDREHVTPYMQRDETLNPITLPALKLSLDTKEDYERILEFYHQEMKAWHYLNYNSQTLMSGE